MSIIADSLLDIGRCLLGCLQPMSGTQARIRVRVSRTVPTANLLPGTFAVPVVGGAMRSDLLFRVAPNGPGEDGRWPSELVEMVSNLGGVKHNAVVAGTELRLDPPPAGFAKNAQVVSVLSQATDPDPSSPCIYGGAVGDSVPALNTLELWRTHLGGRFPGVLVTWANSSPADGLATSTQARGNSRAAEGEQFYAETWVVYLVSSREDGESARRVEGLRLLDEATAWLSDRQTLDHLVFSNPAGIQIRFRQKPEVLVRDLAQALVVYSITLATTHMVERRDVRTYNDLKTFTAQFNKVTDGQPAIPVVGPGTGPIIMKP